MISGGDVACHFCFVFAMLICCWMIMSSLPSFSNVLFIGLIQSAVIGDNEIEVIL